MSRAIPGLEAHLQTIEDAIKGDFIPGLLGCTVEEAAKEDLSTFKVHF
jgi:hypothetical protein